MKIVNTPKQRVFFRHTALNFLAIRQDACENLPCLAKKFLAVGHIANYQTSPKLSGLLKSLDFLEVNTLCLDDRE